MKYKRITVVALVFTLFVTTLSYAGVSETTSDAALKVAQEVSSQNGTSTELKSTEEKKDITESYTESADTLYCYGLMKGTEEGYKLEEKPSRAETAIMYVRMLGAENIVQNGDFDTKFIDVPEWAKEYVGYLYDFGYVNGVSQRMFGSNENVSADTYGYFLLKSLGYGSKDNLTPDTALDVSAEEGIFSDEVVEQLDSLPFNRGTMAYMSCKALQAEIKDEDVTLGEHLNRKGVITYIDLPPEEPEKQVVQAEATVQPAPAAPEPTSVTQKIIENASRYMGIKYRSGGRTPATGFDCSGYVNYVMIQSGVWNQYYGSCGSTFSQCTVVSKENAMPGDIVFFTGTYRANSKYTHVGIYLGNGNMIHSSSSNGISVSTIESGYWASHYSCIARPKVLA